MSLRLRLKRRWPLKPVRRGGGQAEGVDTFVNIHHGAKWTEKGSRPSFFLPSLTFALRGSPKPWIISRGRPVTPSEAARFQGVVLAEMSLAAL